MRNPPVKLLDRVRQSIRLKGYSIRTEKTYVSWIRRGVNPLTVNLEPLNYEP